MLDLRKTAEMKRGRSEYLLFSDETLLEGVDIAVYGHNDDGSPDISSVSTTTQQATNTLLEYPLSGLMKLLGGHLRFCYEVSWHEAVGSLWINDNLETEERSSFALLLSKVSRWRRVYSFEEYFAALLQAHHNSPLSNVVIQNPDDYGELRLAMPWDVFMVDFLNVDRELPLKDEVERSLNAFRTIHEKVVGELETKFPPRSMEVSFDFPEELRVPCEQYLLYFVQFLKDLGVDATAELKHVAGEVLFAVTPTDKQTALDNIRTALQTYLQLPSRPVGTDSILEYEIAVQRLAANVDHLKGQLRLKNAELQLAHATMQTQQLAIQVLKGDVLVDSVKDVTPRVSDDKESFLGGTVALKPFNYKGIELNYPEIFRKLRDLFRKANK